jgi:hypothetical protein
MLNMSGNHVPMISVGGARVLKINVHTHVRWLYPPEDNMARGCDFCSILNQYVCEGHCGSCDDSPDAKRDDKILQSIEDELKYKNNE